MKVPTLAEFRAALEESARTPDGAFTSEEWGDMLGIGRERARQLIRRGVMSGKMRADTVLRENPMRPGWKSTYTVYAFTGGKR